MTNTPETLNILTPDFRMPEHCGGDRWSILHGDSLQILRQFEPNSFDAIITDPPYASGGSSQTTKNRSTNEKYSSMSKEKALPDFDSDQMDEIALVVCVVILGILVGAKRFTVRMAAVYAGMVVLHIIGTNYLTGTLQIAIVTFTVFIRKIFPCAMLGGILVSTTRVNEFMAAMNRIHMPKAMVIPLTVMLRYFPMVHEDWGYISDAMRMRDVAPTVKSLLTHPARTVECIYVPMMMSALKVADELSAAAVTRGLENPKPRTCLQEIHFSVADAVCFILFTLFMSVSIWLKLKGGAG